MSKFSQLLGKAVEQAAGTALGVAALGFITYTFVGVSHFYILKENIEKTNTNYEKTITELNESKQTLIDKQNHLTNQIIKMTTDRILPIQESIKTLNDSILPLRESITVLEEKNEGLRGLLAEQEVELRKTNDKILNFTFKPLELSKEPAPPSPAPLVLPQFELGETDEEPEVIKSVKHGDKYFERQQQEIKLHELKKTQRKLELHRELEDYKYQQQIKKSLESFDTQQKK